MARDYTHRPKTLAWIARRKHEIIQRVMRDFFSKRRRGLLRNSQSKE